LRNALRSRSSGMWVANTRHNLARDSNFCSSRLTRIRSRRSPTRSRERRSRARSPWHTRFAPRWDPRFVSSRPGPKHLAKRIADIAIGKVEDIVRCVKKRPADAHDQLGGPSRRNGICTDSPVEREGFEPSVPHKRIPFQVRLSNGSAKTKPTQVLDPAKFKQGAGDNEAGFCGHCTKKPLEIRTAPSSVPARKSWRRGEKRRDTARLRRFPTRSHWTTLQLHHQYKRFHENRTKRPAAWS
jgi:hypothetical protein